MKFAQILLSLMSFLNVKFSNVYEFYIDNLKKNLKISSVTSDKGGQGGQANADNR